MSACIFNFRFCLILLAAMASTARIDAQQPAKRDLPEPTLDEPQIRKLVDQLGADQFRLREAATKRLSELADVPPALRAAMKSDNVEARRRAILVVSRISKRMAEKNFRDAAAELHKFELDDLVHRLVTDEKSRTAKNWQLIESVVKAVTRRARDLDENWGEDRFPVPDFDLKSMPIADLSKWESDLKGKIVLFDNPIRLRTSINNCLVLCSGAMPYTTALSNSIVIADGDICGATIVRNCLLITRGNFGGANTQGSIILASGLSGRSAGFDDSFLQAANKTIRFTTSKQSAFVKTEFKTTGPSTSRTIDVDNGPLQLLKFSPRKGFDQMTWSKEVDGLVLAIDADTWKDRILIRLKNIGKVRLDVPNMPIELRLKGSDGKVVNSRRDVSSTPPRIGPRSAVLDPDQTYESTLYLWNFLEKPAANGKYQLTIVSDQRRNQQFPATGARLWTSVIESKPLEIMVGK